MSELQELVGEYRAPLEWQGPTTPTTPPRDILLANLSCVQILEGCRRNVLGAKTAVEALSKYGWEINDFSSNDPQTWPAAVEQAVNIGADALLLSSIDQNLIKEPLKMAKEAGMVVVSFTQANEPKPDGVDADVTFDGEVWGEIMGSYILSQHKCDVNVLPTSDRAYVHNVAYIESIIDFIRENCPQATIHDVQNFTGNDVPDRLPSLVVTQLQADPEINVLLVPYDPAAQFIVPAIVNAGLEDQVKLYSQVGVQKNFDYIREGTASAAVLIQPLEWHAWAGIDQIIRLLNDEPLEDQNIPTRLIDRTNVPPPGAVESGAEADYEGHYKELWGID